MTTVSTLSPQLSRDLSQTLAEPAWLATRRSEAWNAFTRLSYPHLKVEEWRYTDLSAVPFEGLSLEQPHPQTLGRHQLPAEVQARLAESDLAGFLVFVGSALVYAEIPAELQARGVVLSSLHQAVQTHPQQVEKALFSAVGSQEKLYAMNAALFTHGAFLYLPAGVEFEAPLAVFHYLAGGHLTASRTLVVAEANSKGVLIEEFLSPAQVSPALSLSVSELLLASGSQLRHAHVQTLGEGFYHFHRTRAVVQRDARLNDLTATFGGTLARAETQSELAGPGADSEMLGLYFAHGSQHLDHYTLQHHATHHTRSDLLYKGAVKDQAHTVYSGLIKLDEGAQKTDAYQSNRNLLLSSEARVDSIPQLEIAANEVRCTHGSTTSPVEEAQLFYLMSRGVPRTVAQQVLVKAHLFDVLTRIPLARLRAHIEKVIDDKVQL